MLTNYNPPQKDLWQGRLDPEETRFHQAVQLIDLENVLPEPNSLTFLGFECDEGIRRNQGRTGAKLGPAALRKALGKLLYSKSYPLFDAGSLSCPDHNLEAAEDSLTVAVEKILRQKSFPLVLGGGHELAWGHYRGVRQIYQDVIVVNFDAHFDLRDDPKGITSGTSFYNIAAHYSPFQYFCAGIQNLSNSPLLFERARVLGVRHLDRDEIYANPASLLSFIEEIISLKKPIYLSLCLDVFQAAAAPGVSSPSPLGLDPALILPAWKALAKSGLCVSLGVAELSPPFDSNQLTANLAAYLISSFIQWFLFASTNGEKDQPTNQQFAKNQ